MDALASARRLPALRAGLQEEDALMRRGIFVEPDTGRAYFSGYAYQTLYDWDQFFEAMVQVYMGWPSTDIRNGVTIFLDQQQLRGMISRSVPSHVYHDPEHVKPFLSQIAVLVARAAEATKSRHAGWGAVNQANERVVRVKSVAACTALWARVATPEHARRMVGEHLFNPVSLIVRGGRHGLQVEG